MSESVTQKFIIQRKGENHDILKEDYILIELMQRLMWTTEE